MQSLSRHAAYGPVVLRVGLGAVFLAHSYAKAFLFTFPGTARFFEAHGFAGWMAYPVFLAELLGGLALVAGFHTRAVSLGLAAVLVGALKVHLGNGWMFTNQGGGWEYVALLMVALVAQSLLGGGAWAVDTESGFNSRAPESTGASPAERSAGANAPDRVEGRA